MCLIDKMLNTTFFPPAKHVTMWERLISQRSATVRQSDCALMYFLKTRTEQLPARNLMLRTRAASHQEQQGHYHQGATCKQSYTNGSTWKIRKCTAWNAQYIRKESDSRLCALTHACEGSQASLAHDGLKFPQNKEALVLNITELSRVNKEGCFMSHNGPGHWRSLLLSVLMSEMHLCQTTLFHLARQSM